MAADIIHLGHRGTTAAEQEEMAPDEAPVEAFTPLGSAGRSLV